METNLASTKLPVRNKRLTIGLLLLTFMVVAVFLASGLFMVAVGDGRFDLTLDVVSSSGKQINDVSYSTWFDQDQADWLATASTEEASWTLHPADRDGAKFVARVPFSVRTNLFNIETSYVEASHIVVAVTDEKGNKVRKSLHVPEGRGPRFLRVSVP